MRLMHEDDFIERINAGDSRAFKQLFDANVSLVYNVCLRMLNNRQDAEDVTQEVFFEAYKAIKQFRFESKLSTWLYRIAVNRSLNHRRSKKLQRWLALDFDAHEETVVNYSGSKEDGADVAMEKKDAERIVLDAINSLPDQQRIAILLHRYEELSYEEIAKIMGGTVASVESRLHRAKQTLAKKLLPLRKEL
ncbi:MAG: sigma-70 family RNA polymerase sigma factor [Ignavibacteriae bacterium]|nr:sigma-70 family RNA polymerase sigma factor [Ignavibacteriota bacterium]